MNLADVEQLMYDSGYRIGSRLPVDPVPPGFKDHQSAIERLRAIHVDAVERNRDKEDEESRRAYWYSLGYLHGMKDALHTP